MRRWFRCSARDSIYVIAVASPVLCRELWLSHDQCRNIPAPAALLSPRNEPSGSPETKDRVISLRARIRNVRTVFAQAMKSICDASVAPNPRPLVCSLLDARQ
jgi:hypothetical protein